MIMIAMFMLVTLCSSYPLKYSSSKLMIHRLSTNRIQMSNNNDDIIMNNNDNSESISKAKLKAEITTPFRLLRFFIYGGIASAAALGSFTAIPQLYISLFSNSNLNIIDRNNAITNVIVDISGLIISILLWRKENINQKQLINNYISKQVKIDNQLTSFNQNLRQEQLLLLPVEIQISEINMNSTRVVSIKDLQLYGQQNVVIVAGNYDFIKDALISARLEGKLLMMIMIVIVIVMMIVMMIVIVMMILVMS